MAADNRLTVLAFVAMVLLAGGNAVGVHIAVQELDPFWAAALRFIAAAALFWVLMAAFRVPVPTRKGLAGALLYGIVGVFLSFALAFWGLRETPPGAAGLVLALVPLLTMLLAYAHGLERLRLRPALGSLVALVGAGLVLANQLQAAVPLLSLLAVFGSAVCLAETGVIVKLIPRSHPVATNAIALAVGGLLLAGLSMATGELWIWPAERETIIAMAFLIVGGSVVVFGLYIFLLQRWKASTVAYEFLLIPLVNAVYAMVFADEVLSPTVIAGGIVILAGVYFGIFGGDRRETSGAASDQRHALTGMALDPPREIELDQRQLDFASLEAREADEFVDLDRRRA